MQKTHDQIEAAQSGETAVCFARGSSGLEDFTGNGIRSFFLNGEINTNAGYCLL
jgi:hypothetical protein